MKQTKIKNHLRDFLVKIPNSVSSEKLSKLIFYLLEKDFKETDSSYNTLSTPEEIEISVKGITNSMIKHNINYKYQNYVESIRYIWGNFTTI